MSTPKQSFNVCEEHIKTTTKFSDELNENTENSNKDSFQAIMKICDVKETRASKLYKVNFSHLYYLKFYIVRICSSITNKNQMKKEILKFTNIFVT